MQTRTLPSGALMPMVGLGTWTLRGDEARRTVITALEEGYRHIDTALAYENHREIAAGIREAQIPREELFIVSKVPRDNLRYEAVLSAIEKTLDELETDYLDLFLIHWPNPDVPMQETFAALAEIHRQGFVRDVGVSNFSIAHLQEAFQVSSIPIANDQVPYHPRNNQESLRQFCEEHNIIVTAYSPLDRGDLLTEPTLRRVAAAQGRTPAQIVLKWLLDKGIVVIPRSRSREHLRENLDLFSWELGEEARRVLDAMGG